jgi:hypothetical protein
VSESGKLLGGMLSGKKGVTGARLLAAKLEVRFSVKQCTSAASGMNHAG